MIDYKTTSMIAFFEDKLTPVASFYIQWRLTKIVIILLIFVGINFQSYGQGKVSRRKIINNKVAIRTGSTNKYKAPSHLSLATVTNSGIRQYFSFDDWESFSKAKKNLYNKIGVCVIKNGHSFIVAGRDACKGELSWRNYQNGVVPGLRCFSTKETAILDFDGKNNSIRLESVNSPSAVAACMYRAFRGDKTEWYLPACGQLWIISQNAFAINKALRIFGLDMFNSTPAYNSSTQYGVDDSYSWGWGVNLSTAGVYMYGRCNNDYVRSVADL